MNPGSYVMGETSAGAVDARSIERQCLDREVFQRLYQDFAPALQSYARRTTGSADLADDIVQNSFLRILQRPLPTLGDRELKSYLFKTATSLLNDHWRKISREQRWRQLTLPLRRRSAPPAARSGFDGLFRSLKPRERALLWLAYVEGHSHDEIAGILGVAGKSVRVLLFRARRKLAKFLAANDSRWERMR